MTHPLMHEIELQDLNLRKMFADAISERGFLHAVKEDLAVFNETLALASARSWMTPARLAKALEVSESNVRKWFKTDSGRVTPARPTIEKALEVLAELVNSDIENMLGALPRAPATSRAGRTASEAPGPTA